jgi:hypothetical protein
VAVSDLFCDSAMVIVIFGERDARAYGRTLRRYPFLSVTLHNAGCEEPFR